MGTINKQYIVDEHNRKIAVQIPIETFERIEEIIENYALVQLMKENEGEELLGVNEAKAYYDQLERAIPLRAPRSLLHSDSWINVY